jgi:hypothetical protein
MEQYPAVGKGGMSGATTTDLLLATSRSQLAHPAGFVSIVRVGDHPSGATDPDVAGAVVRDATAKR